MMAEFVYFRGSSGISLDTRAGPPFLITHRAEPGAVSLPLWEENDVAREVSGAVVEKVEEWSPDQLIREGIVSVRQLSQHTTQVLKAMEERGRPVFVTRHSKIIATMTPLSMREVVDTIIANDSELRNRMSSAEQAFDNGKTRSVQEFLDENVGLKQ
jgi:antitoxin (DNA-binding transcriptional repressor) of toxin-antitoxin stability system